MSIDDPQTPAPIAGNYLVIIAPDGRMFRINENDIINNVIPPGTDQYKEIEKKYVENNSILAFAGDPRMDTCICVVLNIKALESRSSRNK